MGKACCGENLIDQGATVQLCWRKAFERGWRLIHVEFLQDLMTDGMGYFAREWIE